MESEVRNGNVVLQMIKSVALALALSLVGAMIFACVLRFTAIPDSAIYPVNQVWKGITVCIGVMIFVRGERGLVKGLGIGLLYCVLSYILFSAIGGSFSLSWLFIVECVITALCGGISGALAVNLKKSV